MKRSIAATVAVIAVAATPSSAAAKTYQSYAGSPFDKPKGTAETVDLNAFLPSAVKIRKGDKVRYTSPGFHTASVLGKGEAYPPPAMPDPGGGTYQGINQPDGSPFFFNGMTKWIYNTAVFGPVGDNVVDDTETHSSGIIPPEGEGEDAEPGSYTLTFKRSGKQTVLCLLHPGMRQKVTVLPKRAKGADKPAKLLVKARKQSAKLYRAGDRAADRQPPANTVFVGQESKQATVFDFLPNALTVPAGTTVDFTNSAPSEVHNMVFIGANGPDGKPTAGAFAEQHTAQVDKIPLGPGAENQFPPGFVYGSEPRAQGAPYAYSGENLGNGFLWTPLLDASEQAPLPSTDKVTFTKAGTYSYYCGIHPFMRATVTVQ